MQGVLLASVTRFLNSLRSLSLSLLIKKTSPLAVKTTGASVVFILARNLKVAPSSLSLSFSILAYPARLGLARSSPCFGHSFSKFAAVAFAFLAH